MKLTVPGLGEWCKPFEWGGHKDIFIVLLAHQDIADGSVVDRDLTEMTGAGGWGTFAACKYMSNPSIWSFLEGRNVLIGLWRDANYNNQVNPIGINNTLS